MSIRLLDSNIPKEDQSVKCNDLTVRGSVVCNESVAVQQGISLNGGLSFEDNSNGALTGKIDFPAITNYVQATANNANVAASTAGVAPQQFMITTYESSAGVGGDIAAGASVSFNVFHSGVTAAKTLILCSKAGSYNGLTEVNDFVSATIDNQFTVTRHNFGSTTASGDQQLLFKLINFA